MSLQSRKSPKVISTYKPGNLLTSFLSLIFQSPSLRLPCTFWFSSWWTCKMRAKSRLKAHTNLRNSTCLILSSWKKIFPGCSAISSDCAEISSRGRLTFLARNIATRKWKKKIATHGNPSIKNGKNPVSCSCWPSSRNLSTGRQSATLRGIGEKSGFRVTVSYIGRTGHSILLTINGNSVWYSHYLLTRKKCSWLEGLEVGTKVYFSVLQTQLGPDIVPVGHNGIN